MLALARREAGLQRRYGWEGRSPRCECGGKIGKEAPPASTAARWYSRGKNPRSSKSPAIQTSRVRVVRLSRERSSRRLKASQYLRASEKLLCIS